jgi:uncharacterized protein YjbI with pentapeptide repeats
MLRHIALIMFMVGFYTVPASAQNADQIATVKMGKSCSGCNLFQANLSYLEGEKMDLSEARLRQSSLALATYDEVNFSKANMSVSNLFGARFNRSDFSGTNLQNATAVGTYFGSSKLAGAQLGGANFSGADLSLVQGLTQSQLDQACGDESTRLPKGQMIPRCS